MWQALNDYRKSNKTKGKEADFVDALMVNKAKFLVESKGHTLEGFYTFDVAAQALPGAQPMK